MPSTVNRERLARTFESLVTIDSVSRQERAVCDRLRNIFADLGAETLTDSAAEKVGGDTGNLIVRFPGNPACTPLLLSAHMDTVEPGRGIVPVFSEGVFSSRGETILGADDKSALAIIIETLQILRETGDRFCPLELVFTVCEEIGLLGAKNLDFSLLSATFGYILDASDTAGIVTRAPGANRLQFVIRGKDAHAGAHPEDGVNAIIAAGKVLARLNPGRVDEITTYNIGRIEGGKATNIVPAEVILQGETRSQDDLALKNITDWIVSIFEQTIAEEARRSGQDGLPSLETEVTTDFLSLRIPETHPLVAAAQAAAAGLNRELVPKASGGGSDANIFFQNGITAGILGTGMQDMHTVREQIALEDMVQATELLTAIIRQHSV